MNSLQIKTLEQFGTKETEDFFDLADSIIEGTKRAKDGDGKVDFPNDLVHYFNVPVQLFTAIQGAEQVPNEWRDLDAAEIDRLESRFNKYANNPLYGEIVGDLLSLSVKVNKLVNAPKEEESTPTV